ncbi:TPA: hypothetical protein ACH3X1_010562 [Trebouxia sp. C0004]
MVITSQSDIAGTLPESWAAAGAFLNFLWLLELPVNGTLPASWGSSGFPALTDLVLQLPMVSGTLPPEWGSNGFQALSVLKLQLPMLSGTSPEWGSPTAFPELMSLLMDLPNITGTLPSAWGASPAFPDHQQARAVQPAPDLDHMEWIQVGTMSLMALASWRAPCQLEGTLPPQWGSPSAFQQLETLYAEGCIVTGAIPPSWGKGAASPALLNLQLGSNALNGTLPPSFPPALQQLELSGNQLWGNLPNNWPPAVVGLTWQCLDRHSSVELGSLTQLQEMTLAINFHADLPTEWGAPEALLELVVMGCGNMNVTGTLPAEWGSPSA